MAALFKRIMPQQTFSANQRPPRDEVLDLGAYTKIQVQARIVTAGSAGNLILEHAAVNEPDAFKAVSGASWPVTPVSNNFTTISDFLRYVRWGGDASVTGTPVALIDIIAKE